MRKAQWTELPAGSDATYYKVRCNLCSFETVKLGGRNVKLCQVGHQGGHHYGKAWDFSVVPMQRTETVTTTRDQTT